MRFLTRKLVQPGDLNEDKINRIPKLLKMLADAGHHTPFEKSAIGLAILVVYYRIRSTVSIEYINLLKN